MRITTNGKPSNMLASSADGFEVQVDLNKNKEIQSLTITQKGEKRDVKALFVLCKNSFNGDGKRLSYLTYRADKQHIKFDGFFDDVNDKNTASKPVGECIGNSVCRINGIPVFKLVFCDQLSVVLYEKGQPVATINPDGTVLRHAIQNVKLGQDVMCASC